MVPFLAIHLDRRAGQTLQRQLYEELRTAILAGRLAPGARLPATRILAGDLAVSRNTVAGAFDQLLAEGYVAGKIGSGTYVAETLPDDMLGVRGGGSSGGPSAHPGRLSARGRVLAATPASLTGGIAAPRPFRLGVPALDQFPRETWARLAARLLRHAPAALLTYGEPAGTVRCARPSRNTCEPRAACGSPRTR